VDLVLATALNKNPAGRYPSCGQFAEALRVALDLRPGEPAEPPPSRAPGRAAEPPATGTGPLDPDVMKEPNGPEREPPAPRHRVPRLVLAAAAVVVVAVGVGAGVALSKPSTPSRPAAVLPAASSRATASRSPSSSPPSASVLAAQQAAALNTLLTSSAAARTALHDAVRQVDACTNLATAVSQLQNVVNERTGEYNRASSLPTSALPDGTAVKSALTGALSSSLKADRDYLTWAQQQQAGGCTPSNQSTAYNAAYGASQLANTAKQAFVQVWNPVAAKYGIKPDSARSI
jgi:hypothetical protein